MPGKQKSGGGAKKIGRNKDKCAAYFREGRREKSKLKHFIESNLPHEADEATKNKLIAEFKTMQSERRAKLGK